MVIQTTWLEREGTGGAEEEEMCETVAFKFNELSSTWTKTLSCTYSILTPIVIT